MAVKSMEMAVEAMASMEIAPGALPHLGKVLEQRVLAPKIGLRWRPELRNVYWENPIELGFSVRRLFIGGEAASEGHQGAHTIGWRAPGVTRAALGCGRPLAPLRLSFGLRPSSGKNRSFGFCFVQFREYFLCSFSETQKQQKTGNWHCGISSIG
jgi:hypothetical protein